MKQIPMIKFQINSNNQFSKEQTVWNFVFGIWSLFEFWILAFGIYQGELGVYTV
jgi:hypothetical protein